MDGYDLYETILGDTWDQIALFVYGDEKYTTWLMKNNPLLVGTVIFSAGTKVYTPEPPHETDDDLPDWRM